MYISSIWLLVGLVKPLYSSHKIVFFIASLCEHYSDLTSPTCLLVLLFIATNKPSYFCCK